MHKALIQPYLETTKPDNQSQYAGATFLTAKFGLSDPHCRIGVSSLCWSTVASVIEKHFVLLLGDDGGVDAAFSLEPESYRS